MTAMNIVHMRVKPGMEQKFLELNDRAGRDPFPGMRNAWVVKTGDRTYCFVAEWDSMQAIVDARPAMIADLDRMRSLLEDQGSGKGVTDPYSGDVVTQLADWQG